MKYKETGTGKCQQNVSDKKEKINLTWCSDFMSEYYLHKLE